MTVRLVTFLLACLACGMAWADSVALQGTLGSKALLIVNGAPPKMVAPGETYNGVKLVSTASDTALVEIDGKRVTLRVGDAPASVGGTGRVAGGNKIVLPADRGGHFMAQGAINGRAVSFMVDTGATAVGLSAAEADRIGLNYKGGRTIQLGTANGPVPGYLVKLTSVRVGEVEVFEVDAIVSPQPMPYVLLGNSFLNRFQMQRTNDQMVLERRY